MTKPSMPSALSWDSSAVTKRRSFLKQLALGLLASACGPTLVPPHGNASTSSASRASALFEDASRRARRRLEAPAIPPPRGVPASLRDIDYERYSQIRYRAEQSLFRGEDRAFEAQLFHRGFLYGREVAIHIHRGAESERLRYSSERFDFPPGIDPSSFGDIGYAGLRLHAPINRDDLHEEMLVFLGASYFRAVGRGDYYGLSGRCYCIDTGLGVPEEFPEIVAIHLVEPAKDERTMHVVVDVRSKRSEAAFWFHASPGEATTLDVEGVIFLRERVDALGLAPLTSMYLFGEEHPGRFRDTRPEVHDSDGLLLVSRDGERIYRRLRNPPRTTLSSFRLDDPRAFGLVQRDRNPSSYQDLFDRYEERPSGLVEPRHGFGKGAVRLFEMRTPLETDDNIGTFFVPDEVGRELRVGYRLTFGRGIPRDEGEARVHDVRIGVPHAVTTARVDGAHKFSIDWGGDALRSLEGVEADVDVSQGTVDEIRVEHNRHKGGARLSFVVHPGAPEVELRAFLRRGDHALGETFSYLIQREEG